MDILKSLADIASVYTVFEENQVLTSEQLNSIARYLEDQTRLSRVKLLGVGPICGLRVSLQADTVRLKGGVGVTTDGDLLHRDDTVYDRYKVYDDSNPRYEAFFAGEAMIAVYELVAKGVEDERASPLSRFATETLKPLNSMAAVLYMESYLFDRDLCAETDCDNLGQDCRNTMRLLLVDRKDAGGLLGKAPVPHEAFGGLSELVADRPLVAPSLNSPAALAQVYRTACEALHKKLMEALPNLYAKCSPFLSDDFPSDPSGGWKSRLAAIRTAFIQNVTGIQYYGGFLKDLVETCNDFRDLLFGDRTWCCPDVDAFPKHLLLGDLGAGGDADANRTPFYPSPLVSRTVDQLRHARFLFRKIDTLIQAFEVPSGAGAAVRITPSFSESHPLEDRAIPYYYAVDEKHPVHENWSYRLHQRNMDAYNYSYQAAAYGAKGAAASPLTAPIGRFPFFRIEGHQGQLVASVESALENEIVNRNLPFVVRSVMIGADRTKVVKKPGIRYTDLHRFHYLLRQDLFHQMDEVTVFSGAFKSEVDKAVAAKIVTDSPDDNDGAAVSAIAAEKNAAVTAKAATARTKVNRTYTQVKADPSWKTDVTDTMRAAGEFKANLGKVVKTEFTTPFDSLIGNTHLQWLDWLDDIIRARDDKEDDRLLFSTFLKEHPGLEHCAGVSRGGTFVLVYDASNRVVADFALPYPVPDPIEDEPDEPPLGKPPIRPPYILDKGFKVLPSFNRNLEDFARVRVPLLMNQRLTDFMNKDMDDLVKKRLDDFKAVHIDTVLAGRLEGFQKTLEQTRYQMEGQQKEYFTLVGSALRSERTAGVAGLKEGLFADAELDRRVTTAREKQVIVDYLRTRAAQPGLAAEQSRILQAQVKEAELDLATTIAETTKYVSASSMDVTVGSQGMAALVELNKGVQTLKDTQAVTTVNSALSSLQASSTNAGLKVALGSMIRR